MTILVTIYVIKKIPIGNNFLILNNELIQYLQQTCNICNSENNGNKMKILFMM